MKTFFVLVKRADDDSIIRKIPCRSEKQAVITADGIDINLDHENFYTEVVEEGAE